MKRAFFNSKQMTTNTIVMALAMSISFVGCGRAQIKTLRKDGSKTLVDTNGQDPNGIVSEPTTSMTWAQRNAEAVQRRQSAELESNPAAATDKVEVTAEVVSAQLKIAQEFAASIKNIDLRIDAKGEKTFSIRIDSQKSKAKYPQARLELMNEQDLSLKNITDFNKVSFKNSESTTDAVQDQWVAESENIKVLITKEDASGLYIAKITSVATGTTVHALIRLNSAAIKLRLAESKLNAAESVSKVFLSSSPVQARIVQLFMFANSETTRVPLSSTANKIKISAKSDSQLVRYIIKGYPSDSSSNPSPSLMRVKVGTSANKESTDSKTRGAFQLENLYGEHGQGRILMEVYKHTTDINYAKITTNNADKLTAIDADILRLTLEYTDSEQPNKLVLDLKFETQEEIEQHAREAAELALAAETPSELAGEEGEKTPEATPPTPPAALAVGDSSSTAESSKAVTPAQPDSPGSSDENVSDQPPVTLGIATASKFETELGTFIFENVNAAKEKASDIVGKIKTPKFGTVTSTSESTTPTADKSAGDVSTTATKASEEEGSKFSVGSIVSKGILDFLWATPPSVSGVKKSIQKVIAPVKNQLNANEKINKINDAIAAAIHKKKNKSASSSPSSSGTFSGSFIMDPKEDSQKPKPAID